MRSSILAAVLLAASRLATASADTLPQASEGWSVDVAVGVPPGFKPSALAVGPRDVVYLGGRSGGIIRIEGDSTSTLADRLGPVAALEWAGDALYVLHGSSLSSLREPGAGSSWVRTEIVAGLGVPSGPGEPEGLGPAAVRRGMDGFLYVAVGDRGVANTTGSGGETLRLQGGGVIRVRPDGSGLEVVSTGDARPGALIVTGADDVFTFSSANDPRWGMRLLQHVPGGRHGYPYHFLTAEFRTLPPTSKLEPGRAGQGATFDRQPAPFNDLTSCEPDAGIVRSNSLKKAGGAFQIARRVPILSRGTLDEFRPIAVASRDDRLWVLDDSSNGRVFRLSRPGEIRETPRTPTSIESLVAELDDASRTARLDAQSCLSRDPGTFQALASRLAKPEPLAGRLHALWALDAIGGEAAREAVRSRLGDETAAIRSQAARSCGIRRDAIARPRLEKLLVDRDPAVRREAAVALGRLGDRTAVPALLAALGDPDRFAAWSIRHAALKLGCDDRAALAKALNDPSRRESALLLADESWSVPVVESLVDALGETAEPLVRGRMIVCLAGQYRRYPEWDGSWPGPEPLAGPLPKKTEGWDPEGMAAVLRGLERGLKDPDATVRYQAAVGLQPVGPPAGPMLREALAAETDVDAQAAIVESLGAVNDATSTRALLPIVVDPERPEAVRSAALDSLNLLRGRDVVRARLTVLYEEEAPEALVAKALPALARDGYLPPIDLAGFLQHASPLVRAAALVSLNPSKPLPGEVKEVVLARFDDDDSDVRRAAFLASGPLRLREAVPKLIEHATKDEHRAAATAALCVLPDHRALAIYVDALDDPDPSLRRGALAALLAIRDDSEADLRRLAADTARTPEESLGLRRVLSHYEAVSRWTILGPFAELPGEWLGRDGSIDAQRAFDGLAEPIRWTPTVADKEGVVDLASIHQPGKPALAAAYAEFVEQRPREAVLVVEADARAELYLNGRRLEPAGASGGTAGDYYLVRLVAGENRVAVVSRSSASGWRFAASVSTPVSERP